MYHPMFKECFAGSLDVSFSLSKNLASLILYVFMTLLKSPGKMSILNCIIIVRNCKNFVFLQKKFVRIL